MSNFAYLDIGKPVSAYPSLQLYNTEKSLSLLATTESVFLTQNKSMALFENLSFGSLNPSSATLAGLTNSSFNNIATINLNADQATSPIWAIPINHSFGLFNSSSVSLDSFANSNFNKITAASTCFSDITTLRGTATSAVALNSNLYSASNITSLTTIKDIGNPITSAFSGIACVGLVASNSSALTGNNFYSDYRSSLLASSINDHCDKVSIRHNDLLSSSRTIGVVVYDELVNKKLEKNKTISNDVDNKKVIELELEINVLKNKINYLESKFLVVAAKLEEKSSFQSSNDELINGDISNLSVALKRLRFRPEIEEALIYRLEEIKRNLSGAKDDKAALSAITNCGSILESIFREMANEKPNDFNQSKSAPKNHTKFTDWDTPLFINVAHDLGIIPEDIKWYCLSLNERRNCVHIPQQIKKNFYPNGYSAKIDLAVLRAAIAHLIEYKISY